MATIKKYNGSTWENAVVRKFGTATADIEPTIYTDGTAITSYTLKGNTTQSGTPTPSNPVEVNGVGVRTENLFDGQLQQGYYAYLTGEYTLADVYVCTHLIPCTENTTYTFRCINTGGGSKNYGYVFFDSAQNRIDSDYINELTEGDVVTHTATTPQNTAFLAINIAYGRRQPSVVRPSDITDFMLNTGSTAKPYEPWGYKIPILTAQGTSNIYLSEPLYKIGDYADTINSDGTVSRRIAKLTFNGDGSVTWNKSSTYQGSFYAYNALVGGLNLWTPMVCTHATWVYPVDVSHYVYGTCGADGSPPSPNLNLFIGQADWNVTQFNQFLAENPVTVYYVLATATTEQITLPAIATTEGANSITVDTTVQPSEFSATWTGWHDSSVKEYDGTNWQ